MNNYQYTVNGKDYVVEIEEIEGNLAQVRVNGKPFEVELRQEMKPTRKSILSPVSPVSVAASTVETATEPVQQQQAAPAAGSGSPIKAPLPGTVTDVKVQVGQQVNVGDTVIVLEAMKMQNNIEADRAGKITTIAVKPGDTVMEGALLLTIG